MDMARTGRPSKYNERLAEQICQHISEGKPLATIATLPKMPKVSTICEWLSDANKDFAERYARAKEQQAQLMAEQIVGLADNPLLTEERRVMGDGTVILTVRDNVERSKLMVDARKWVAAKLLPKVYGERYQAEHTGSVGLQLVHDVPRPERVPRGTDEPPLIEGK